LGAFRYLTSPTSTLSPVDMRAQASTLPACASFFDGGQRTWFAGAVVSPTIEMVGPNNAVVWSTAILFPTAAAASHQMDPIATKEWMVCDTALASATLPLFESNTQSVTSTGTAIPPASLHGDRMVSVGLVADIDKTTGPYHWTGVTAWTQVGRGIVSITADATPFDSTDPAGLLEKALTLATNRLKTTLRTP
jgi:hypothetical protein